MRKFTKEITALMASAALGAAAGVGAFSASSEEISETAGVEMIPDETVCTTEEIVKTEGVAMIPDETIYPTELPPLEGEALPPDDITEPTEIPPLMGDIAPADGDVNGDGLFDVADVVLFQKWLINSPDSELFLWWTADFYPDGKLDAFDFALMRQSLLDGIN